MSIPSKKMLDKLSAAMQAIPCTGYCFAYNDARENDCDNFTTIMSDTGPIFRHIPSLELANEMARVTNAVSLIQAKVYGRA